MSDLRREAYGPVGDADQHRSGAALDAALRALSPAARDHGRLLLIVCRRADGVRDPCERVRATCEDGVHGDGWSRRPPRDLEAQLAVMRHDVAALIANRQPLTIFGDNLFVDLDISAENLPAGMQLRVGAATVEVTPKPHNGCVKFKGRFGDDALRFVHAPSTRDQNLRGVYWKVIEPGDIWVGAPIDVLARPPRPA
jgi:hypothetical protein